MKSKNKDANVRQRAQRPEFPPSLNRVPTEYQRLCAELGGPAPIREGIKQATFEHYCHKISWSAVEQTLRRFAKDIATARRHWPWVAMAIGEYKLERIENDKPADELSPKEIGDLFREIAHSARSLIKALLRLQKQADRLAEPTAPLRSAHLAYLDQFVAQVAAGRPAAEVSDDGLQMLIDDLGRKRFIERVCDVEIAAKEAASRLDRGLLARSRGQLDPGLSDLVRQGAEIWQSMTGRKASANKVHREVRRDDDDPDFVIFIKDLVSVADGPKPTRKMIEASLKPKKSHPR